MIKLPDISGNFINIFMNLRAFHWLWECLGYLQEVFKSPHPHPPSISAKSSKFKASESDSWQHTATFLTSVRFRACVRLRWSKSHGSAISAIGKVWFFMGIPIGIVMNYTWVIRFVHVRTLDVGWSPISVVISSTSRSRGGNRPVSWLVSGESLTEICWNIAKHNPYTYIMYIYIY